MIKASIIGASGYTGGDLLRLLLMHPEVEVDKVTSERNVGKPVTKLNPNLRKFTDLKFTSAKEVGADMDVVFLCVPHKTAQDYGKQFYDSGIKVIDLSADFRLRTKERYEKYYCEHKYPELLSEAVYGMPELHREEIRKAKIVGSPGCLSTSAILACAPLLREKLVTSVTIDSKIGSSAAGAKYDISTHHPERRGTVRAYKPTGHRHIAEIEQELSLVAGEEVRVGFSPHQVETVRGIFTTVHATPSRELENIDLWKAYRGMYGDCPFVRFVKEQQTLFRYPEPTAVAGTNFCDIGFEIDANVERVVAMSSIDNLIKGSGGQSIECMNLMFGLEETAGLWYPGLHPY
jgi:N-acetyl-gamma-glutamyl-phosphate/LysW-gamma-L-alpha-aminoadipyl-6-phosphate reductase